MSEHDGGMRLNKYLASCGVASRRGADALVAEGRVTVNGEKPEGAGMRVDPEHDVVRLNGRPVRMEQRTITLLLHKPPQVVTTVSDPQGRTTVLDLLTDELRRLRPFPVGRLDYFSEGLLLLTTDGELCNRLTHPRHHLPKVYEVTVRPAADERQLDQMRKGMRLQEGDNLAPVDARVLSEHDGKQVLELTLRQGVNRQVRRMCRDLGLTVLRLMRVSQGPIQLGDLGSGKWRPLGGEELQALRKACDLG